MKGFSSIVSFYIKGGIKEAHVFLDSLQVFLRKNLVINNIRSEADKAHCAI